ncbi:MAG: 2TM domain-containing protein [Actinomycetota bacterium]|nr:2TM domain-containing protein [Actinomycetota bacterium]
MEDEKYKRAKKRVEEIKGFFGHLFAYLGVNVTLLVINLVSAPNNLWFYWVTLFWGIGLFWHAMGVFAFSLFSRKRLGTKKDKRAYGEAGAGLINSLYQITVSLSDCSKGRGQ